MPWQVRLVADDAIVLTHYHGGLSASDLRDACRETMVVARQAHCHRYLTDCRGLAGGGHSLADLFYLIDYLVDEGLDADISREAVIGDPDGDMAQKIEFWENAMVNRGFNVRRFTDYDDAVAWLKSDA